MPYLLICVDGNASDEEADACRREAEALGNREWTYDPRFVDQIDAVPVFSPGQSATVRTAGVAIDLPELGDGIDGEAIRADVNALVTAMSALAQRHRVELSVEYREEQIGSLDGGESDARVVPDFFGS